VEPFQSKVRQSFGRQAFMTTLGAEIECIAPGRVEIHMHFALNEHGHVGDNTASVFPDRHTQFSNGGRSGFAH
jgi:acyl-coenzyme A thioesterase PaaI-like protein